MPEVVTRTTSARVHKQEEEAIKALCHCGTHYVIFDFDGNLHLVLYRSEKNLRNEIIDGATAYFESDYDENLDYEDIIADIMNSFNVSWLLEDGVCVIRPD